MFVTDSNFVNLATAQSRSPIIKLLINGVETDLLKITYDSPQETFVGGFASSYITFEIGEEMYAGSLLDAIVEPFISFKGSTIWVPIGKFTVDRDELKFNDINKVYTCAAYDNAVVFDVQYEPLDFPLTGAQIVSEISERIGINQNNSIDPLKHDSTIFEGINVSEGESISYRRILSDYAKMNLASALIDRTGNLCFKSVFNNEAVVQIDGHDYTGLKIDKEVKPINSLVYQQNNIEDPVYALNYDSVDSFGLTELIINENIFLELYDRDAKQHYVEEMFIMVDEFIYHPFESDQIMRPDFDSLDTVNILDVDDTSFRSVITSINWTWENGGLRGKTKCPQLPETITNYTLSGEKQDKVNMGIMVDRINKRITTEVSEVYDEIGDLGTEFREVTNTLTVDINGITDRVTTVESDLETNYATIEYSNELTRNAIDGLTNTYSRLGGANLVMNSALYHGLEDDYDHWRGNLVRLSSDTTKSRTAIGLKSGTVYQDISNVQTGWISLRFYVGIQAGLDDGNVQFKINETLYDVVPNNFVELTFEHTQSNIELSFITNMSGKYYISDLMMNYGKDMFLDYQQAQNELHTSSVQISERIRVESNVVNTITYLGANGLEGYNKSTGSLVFKQTDTGLEAVSIKSGDAEIAGIAITLVGNQTWFTGL